MEERKTCPYCGSEISDSAKKCKYCGEWLVVQEKDKPKTSMHFGTVMEVLIAILSIPIGIKLGSGFAISFITVAYIGLNLYFLPTLIADGKRTQYTYAIFALNLILGATVIFWVVCLVWALSLPDLSKNIEHTINSKGQSKTFMQVKDDENKVLQEKSTQNVNTTIMPNETKKCPYCAELIPQNSIFCSICETSLTEKLSNRVPQIEYTNIIKNVCNDEIPNNIKQWNWGAFWFSWIWGIANKSYLTLLTLIPFFNFIWMFVCGFKGNEWAWKNKKWHSLEAFNNTQKKWAIVGNCIAVLSLVLTLALWVVVQNVSNEPVSKEPTLEQEEVNPNTEERGDIIDMTEDVDNHITSKSEQPNSKSIQQLTPQKVQLQPVVQHTTKTTPTHINTVVPQTKPVETQQNNQDIDDFMN